MIDPLTGALIFGGLSAGTSFLGARADEKNQRINNNLQADMESTSWATGRRGRPSFQAKNPYVALLGGGMQGAATGYAQGQNFQNADANNQLMKARTQSFQPSQSIYSQMMPDMQLKKGFNY